MGIEQYQWLEDVLSQSDAAYKFVFIHNLTGGIDREHRGGATAADLYEWGGSTPDGQDAFSQQRPDFDMPIHDLLVKYHVNAVFHGHDHFYAHEEKDGIAYILVPQPGTIRPAVTTAAEKGYTDGLFLPSAGFLNVIVPEEGVSIEYCKTFADGGIAVADSFELR